jgi:spermidine/putrescine transport system ATP-binding protein
VIEIQNLTKRFGPVLAVDDVSLSVRRGEFLTLLGPSGCGKTTLLRTLSGFERPDSGSVTLDGHDVTDLPPYRRDVNQVFQSYALFPHLTVWKNVAFGLKMKRLPRRDIHRRVAEVLSLVELTGMESRKPHQLSGGQRQRVALARAIVNRPKVLLLDEPLAALDAKLRHAMQLELKRLQQRLGITFVFVTHDQSEALAMSDRIAVMNAGRIEQLGTPTDIYRRPATPFVGRFVGHANLWEATPVPGTDFVQVGDLELPVDPLPPGSTRVTLLVRPEHVTLGAPDGFDATVLDHLFTGPLTLLRLRTPGGVELQATVTDHTPYTPGQPVRCLIAKPNITILP